MTRNEHDGQKRGGTSPRRTSTAKSAAKPRAAKSAPVAETDEAKGGRQRIAKLIARAGLCSRRDAEAWIIDGRVSVNGEVLTSPAIDVGDADLILVDGEPLPAADKTRLFLFHKPKGLITSDHDPEGRETIFDHLREHWPDGPRVVTIGRLDINTEGLLLLTNDGGLARVLELPATGWVRRYRVRAKGETDQAVLDRLLEGVTIEGIEYAGIEAKLDRVQGANCWLTMGLREGKNREVKRVLEHIGLEVNRLIRLSFGPFQLLDLPEGQVEEVKTRILRDQLGPTLAAQAGVDFSEPEPLAPIVAAPVRETIKGRKDRTERPSRAPAKEAPAPRGRNFRDRERDVEPAAAPQIRERPVSGPRKHVSTLRAETATSRGPRKRTERTETSDSKRRVVTVERLVSTEPARAPRGRPDRRERSEPARRERGEAPSFTRRERPESAPRRERTESAPRRERSESAPRRERSESAPRRERTDSAPRRERAESAPRRERTESAPRRERSESAPRRERTDTAPRRERNDAPPRRERSEAPARRERGESPARREWSDAPARRERSDAPTPGFKKPYVKAGGASQSALGKRERIARSGGALAEPRAPRNRAERSFSDNRAARSEERATRRDATEGSETRAPRRDSADAPRARSSKPYAAKESSSRGSGERSTGRPATGRAPKRESHGKNFGGKPSGRSAGDRPARGGGKSFGERPARPRGDAPGRPPRGAGPSGTSKRPPRGGKPDGGARPPRRPRG
ncbi:MAG: pseudouridine synthase [Beijerinckiaceae bacterium]|nr:pseudouridine synthase [Beijerinckiaceae bacterium]